MNELSLIDKIHYTLDVIMHISRYCDNAYSLKGKLQNVLCDWDLNYIENKPLVIELWHFLNSIRKVDIHGCDMTPYCKTETCYDNSIDTTHMLPLSEWWKIHSEITEVFNNMVDNNIIAYNGKLLNGTRQEDNLFIKLTEIAENIECPEKFPEITELLSELTNSAIHEYPMALKNPDYLHKLTKMLQTVSVYDFKFVMSGIHEYKIVGFYEWWKDFNTLREKMNDQ